MKIGIIIPLYNAGDNIKKCMEAIKNQILPENWNYELYTKDNTTKNIGFTAVINEGLKLFHDFDYAIGLNQDCYLKPDAIKNMVNFMEEHKNCAIGGIKQIDYNDNDRIIHGGCTKAFPFGIHICGSVKNNDCSENKKMPWVNGACFIVRMEYIIDIGLMDKNYFLIGSDADFCFTARNKGYDVWYIANAECYHEHGITKSNNDDNLKRKMLLDMTYFRDKWIGQELFKELQLEVF
jgi:GT2 family glycosyltransferase